MSQSDCEIEYLDEDADLVQQCFQSVQAPEVYQPTLKPKLESIVDSDSGHINYEQQTPLLVERRRAGPGGKNRKKRKREEDDSDYDPGEDVALPSPPASPQFKKKKMPKHVKILYRPGNFQNKFNNSFSSRHVKGKQRSSDFGVNRKIMNIKIPDYDDPLCLPVKALLNQESDLKKLENWNNVCLEHFKHCTTLLKPERGETKSSVRTLVLRNVGNKQTGKVETTIWSKTSVENEEGDKKSEIFHCVLPRYKEKLVMNGILFTNRKARPMHLRDEALLTREHHKEGEVLVVYKPKEALSSVYKMFDRRCDEEKDYDEEKMFLKEVTCCKVCARCYQSSWRGVNKSENKNKTILCPICGRTYVSVYNLLAHLKTHSSEDTKKCRKVISTALADIVSYHYKCRICQMKYSTIKSLLQHVNTHKCMEEFRCDVGDHLTF